jgi:hypothetical protein
LPNLSGERFLPRDEDLGTSRLETMCIFTDPLFGSSQFRGISVGESSCGGIDENPKDFEYNDLIVVQFVELGDEGGNQMRLRAGDFAQEGDGGLEN